MIKDYELEDWLPEDESEEEDEMTRTEFVQEALIALGSAYRGDWSGFDGRQLRAELEEIAGFLNEDVQLPSFDEWLDCSQISQTSFGYKWSE